MINAIEISGLSKTFPGMDRPALDAITASIKKGMITGLVGPDGAGKTTLIRLMAGLLLPNHGHIKVLGLDTVQEADDLHDIMGYMPQKFGLYEDLTVIENLNLYAELHGLGHKEKEAAFTRMLNFTSLQPFVDRLAGNLSGGMKQKLGLACSLLGHPKVLLLDEPSVGVDPLSRRELWKMVQDLVTEGLSVVWSTAYLDEADKCHQVLLLNEGKLLFNGPPKDLTNRVKGRVFLWEAPLKNHRQLLSELLSRPGIIDGVIQGKKIRIVCAPSCPVKSRDPEWKSVEPRFEDAFVDVLGGGPDGDSILADHIPQKTTGGRHPIQAENLTKKIW